MSEANVHRLRVDRAAAGDDEALAALVRRYHDRVYRFGLRVCHDGFDADDAVQEAFIRLARRPDVVADQGALSWLMSVVRHVCLRMLRPFVRERRSLGERAEPAGIASALADPARSLERFEMVQQVHAAIAALDRPHREVLVLRDLEGLSGEETAAALGIGLASMKSRLHRARAMLRTALHEATEEVA